MDIDSGKTKANPNPSEIQLNIISRDDRRVARAIYDGEQLNSIHVLGSGGLLDGVLVFMNDIGYMDFLKRFNIFNYKRMILPLFRFILVYMAKLIIGIPSMTYRPGLETPRISLSVMASTHRPEGIRLYIPLVQELVS